jgi:hypothetical protein
VIARMNQSALHKPHSNNQIGRLMPRFRLWCSRILYRPAPVIDWKDARVVTVPACQVSVSTGALEQWQACQLVPPSLPVLLTARATRVVVGADDVRYAGNVLFANSLLRFGLDARARAQAAFFQDSEGRGSLRACCVRGL